MAVGNEKIGPAPHMKSESDFGDMKRVALMSPSPHVPPLSERTSGW